MNIVDLHLYGYDIAEQIKILIPKLLEKEMLLNLDEKLYEPLRYILKQMYKNRKIENYQIGSMGDYGLHIFINRKDVIMPVNKSSYDTRFLAC